MKRAIAVLLLLLLLLVALPQGRASGRAVLLSADLLSPAARSPLLALPAPAAGRVTIPTGGKPVPARLYTPAGGRQHSALILVTGYPQNVEDGDLNRLADRLARLGIAVLIPQLPDLRRGLLTTADVDDLVIAFRWLQARSDIAAEKIGLAGFCVGSSLALLAAAAPEISADVALVNVFGGYYDLAEFLRAIALHQSRYGEKVVAWDPAQQTELLFIQNILHNVGDDAERERLEGYLRYSGSAPQLRTATGQAAFTLLQPGTPAQVDAALMALPAVSNGFTRALSPSAVADEIEATVLIMHDQHDPYVPVSESLTLRDSLLPVTYVHYTSFRLFDHVRPDVTASNLDLIPQALKLIRHLSHLFYALT